jgi:hypothetical protein
MEPKGRQNETRNLLKHPLRKRIEKVRKKGATGKRYWEPFISEILNKYNRKFI